MNIDLREVIFFEKQESRLCAQHALNMLLQGPYFSADVLAEIAQQLDEEEKRVLSPEAQAQFQSQNYDDSGFFSIQVITAALQRSWDLNLIPIRSPDLAEYQASPEKANAYICNLQEHWFVLRKFYKQWYDLNSVTDGPKPVSDTYLEVYLQQLHTEGYAIFYVDGLLPNCVADEVAQEKFTLEESLKDSQQPEPSAPSANQISEEDQLELAIALSLSEAATKKNNEVMSDLAKSSASTQSRSVDMSDQPGTSGSRPKTEAELLRDRREAFLKKFENND